MTISKRVQKELVMAKPMDVAVPSPALVATPQRVTKAYLKTTHEAKRRREAIAARTKGQAWTPEEHARFLEALQVFPSGPWEAVAEYVGTKNSRQTMTHAQKYRQKHERQQRGLRQQGKKARATPYPVVKKELVETDAATKILSMGDEQPATAAEVESPRSGEDECGLPLPPIGDLTLLTAPMTPEEPSLDESELFKLDTTPMLEQLFSDFEPHAQALQAWSTNSLMDKLDELSALPEDFSQSLGLWV